MYLKFLFVATSLSTISRYGDDYLFANGLDLLLGSELIIGFVLKYVCNDFLNFSADERGPVSKYSFVGLVVHNYKMLLIMYISLHNYAISNQRVLTLENLI